MIYILGEEDMKANLGYQTKLRLHLLQNMSKAFLVNKLLTLLVERIILLQSQVRNDFMVGENHEWVNLGLKQSIDLFLSQSTFLFMKLNKSFPEKDQVKFQ
jgi:hypothetical protein